MTRMRACEMNLAASIVLKWNLVVPVRLSLI
jgi:hypothetical protein